MFSVKFFTFVAILFVSIAAIMARPSDAESDIVCPQICTKEYAPVCATLADGSSLEFGNKCMSNVAKCNRNLDIQVLVEGKCGQVVV